MDSNSLKKSIEESRKQREKTLRRIDKLESDIRKVKRMLNLS